MRQLHVRAITLDCTTVLDADAPSNTDPRETNLRQRLRYEWALVSSKPEDLKPGEMCLTIGE